MKQLHRRRAFLRAYRYLPHRLLNRAAAALTGARSPRFLVDAAVRLWIRRGHIDMRGYEPGPFATVDDFFLRRLRPGARPLAPGIISPVDGNVVAIGALSIDARLNIKGSALSLSHLVNGALHDLPLDDYSGGRYAVIFLTPDGYHRIHMPASGVISTVQFLPGRFFPQNDDALAHLDNVYEKNERAVLRLRLDAGHEALLVLVGASLIGGIEIEGLARHDFARRAPLQLALRREKGDEIGRVRFGSTIVLLFPRGVVDRALAAAGDSIAMGRSLFE
jgi:phosphatidylserine decarboxylase